MSTYDYQEKLKIIQEAVLKTNKIQIWVKDTSVSLGHLLNPYAILEDSLMQDVVYSHNEEQNIMLLTRVNEITKVKITDSTFQKPDEWSKSVDDTKFKITTS